MGYRACVEYISWSTRTEKECNAKQGTELLEVVAKTIRDGGKVEITRNLIKGAVIIQIDGTSHRLLGTDVSYSLQRPMTDTEIMEEGLRIGVWATRK